MIESFWTGSYQKCNVMVAISCVFSDAQVMMLKTGIALNEIPVKGASRKAWSFLVHQNKEDDDEELSMNQRSLSRRRFRDESNYPMENEVRIYFKIIRP